MLGGISSLGGDDAEGVAFGRASGILRGMKRFFLLAPLLILGATSLAWLPSCASDDTCPKSIPAYCAQFPGGCPMTWAAAQDAGAWSGICDGTVVLARCANVYTASLPNIDVGVVFDYDPASGALYRVESVGQKDVCYAGSGSLQLCDDPNEVWLQCTPTQ